MYTYTHLPGCQPQPLGLPTSETHLAVSPGNGRQHAGDEGGDLLRIGDDVQHLLQGRDLRQVRGMVAGEDDRGGGNCLLQEKLLGKQRLAERDREHAELIDRLQRLNGGHHRGDFVEDRPGFLLLPCQQLRSLLLLVLGEGLPGLFLVRGFLLRMSLSARWRKQHLTTHNQATMSLTLDYQAATWSLNVGSNLFQRRGRSMETRVVAAISLYN
jgi:hypothetical protein